MGHKLEEADCNNYSQIGLGHKVSKEWNTIEPKSTVMFKAENQ